MKKQNLAQRRADHALSRIEAHRKISPETRARYLTIVESLPATILMNGLGQAAATLLSKAKGDFTNTGDGLLYVDLQDWLCGGDEAAPYRNADGGGCKLINAIVKKNEADYLRAQAEALAYLVWLKKFANAYLSAAQEPEQQDLQ